MIDIITPLNELFQRGQKDMTDREYKQYLDEIEKAYFELHNKIIQLEIRIEELEER